MPTAPRAVVFAAPRPPVLSLYRRAALGEYVRERRVAEAMGDALRATIEGLTGAGIAPFVSVKPTQLGPELDPELAADLAVDVARRAEAVADRYGYFSRRLAERPANAAVVLRGLFG